MDSGLGLRAVEAAFRVEGSGLHDQFLVQGSHY